MIFRFETVLSAIFYQPEGLELQQPSGNALDKSEGNIAASKDCRILYNTLQSFRLRCFVDSHPGRCHWAVALLALQANKTMLRSTSQ
ncbi:MAG: hypothetical protein K940chlam7_00663 [Chlamydiae bacterium]|nr:hypothetical protein [Chlamydiota bacterium]